MTDLSALFPTSRRVARSARSAGTTGLKVVSALGILSLHFACSSDPETPDDGSAGKAVGGASGGSAPMVAGSTAAGTSPMLGGTGGAPSFGGSGGSAGTATGGTLSPSGGGGQGGGSAGRGGNATAGSSAGSGGKAGSASGGASGGGAGGSGGKAGGGAGGGGGAAGSAGSGNAGAAGGGAYKPCPTNGDPCKIIPMGDSITVGIGTGTTGGGYRIELFKKATADGKKITFDGVAMSSCNISTPQNPPSGFVNTHSACSGWTIQQIAGMVAGSVQKKPDIILLMAGTNDVRGDANGAPMRLGTLLDQIFTADSHVLVVVAKLTPLSGANLTQLNTGIQSVVEMRAAAGKHVMLVDMNTGYPANSMPDGVHPNQTGYVWMADVWYKAIKDLLP